MINPVTSSGIQHLTSINISTPLMSLILQQSTTYPISCQESQRDCKRRAIKHKRELEQNRVLDLVNKLLPVTKKPCPSSVKKVHRAGSQPFHYQKMVMLCIKGPLEMPFVSDMAGPHHFYHLTVFVDTISLLKML